MMKIPTLFSTKNGKRLLDLIGILVAVCLVIFFMNPFSQGWKSYPHFTEKDLLKFPIDEGSHANSLLEWWFITFNGNDGNGKNFSFHLLIIDQESVHFSFIDWSTEKFYSENIDTGITSNAEKLSLGYDSGHNICSLEQVANMPFTYKLDLQHEFVTDFERKSLNIEFMIDAMKPPMVIDSDFLSRVMELDNTRLYYLPRLRITGQLLFDGNVFNMEGLGVMEHFWTYETLVQTWEWISINLFEGQDLIVWPTIKTKSKDNLRAMFFSDEQGKVKYIENFSVQYDGYIQPTNSTNYRFSLGWKLDAEAEGLHLHIKPAFPEQISTEGFLEAASWATGVIDGENVGGYAFAECSYRHPLMNALH